MTDREVMKMAFDAFEDLKKSVTRDGTVSENWDAYYEKEYYALEALRQALAQPEQASNDPPAYVEPPTSDYHNGWEEGFEAAKNLFNKESAPQNADPRLLLGRKDNCIALAQPEQESISTNDHLCAMLRQVHDVLACTALPMKRPWVGLTGLELNHVFAANVGYPERMCRAIEAKLKEKNGG